MITTLHIDNFRGFHKLDVHGLARFNLIVGQNSVGKTALMEAFSVAGASQPTILVELNALRGILPGVVERDSRSIFQDWFGDADKPFVISTENEDGPATTTIATLRPAKDQIIASGNLDGLPQDLRDTVVSKATAEELHWIHKRSGEIVGESVMQAYGLHLLERELRSIPKQIMAGRSFVPSASTITPKEIERFDKLKDDAQAYGLLLETLRKMQPALADIEVRPLGGRNVLAGRLDNGKRLPLGLLGEGVVRSCQILLAVIGAGKRGRVCVDELDGGLHHSVQRAVFTALRHAVAELDGQLFATTHSDECISAAHEAFQDAGKDLMVFRVDRDNTSVAITAFDAATRRDTLAYNFDMR